MLLAFRRQCAIKARFGYVLRRFEHTGPPGLLKYCELPHRSHLHIRGPDAVKFLNGLMTSKLIPTYVKKNLTTISMESEENTESEAVAEFDMSKGNWGLYKEYGMHGPYISRFGTYTSLLSIKGKLMTDAIIYPTPALLESVSARKYPEYLLEVDRQIADRVSQILNSHTLASKVKSGLVPAGKFRTWHLSIELPRLPDLQENPWLQNVIQPSEELKGPESAIEFGQHFLSIFFSGRQHEITAAYIDFRYLDAMYSDPYAPLVLRIVTKADVLDLADIFKPRDLPFEFSVQKMTPQEVRRQRYHNGLIEGLQDFKPETLLPLELNFDFLPNTVSFDKGCYVGQELTARTFATGILRKRAVPVNIENGALLDGVHVEKYLNISVEGGDEPVSESPAITSNSQPFTNTQTTRGPRRQRPAGSLLCHEGDSGVAIIRTEYFKTCFANESPSALRFYINIPESQEKVYINPQKPHWFDEWLEQDMSMEQ